MIYANCSLGDVQSQDDGKGFVFRGDQNKPLMSLTYESEARAEQARKLMARVLEGASVAALNNSAGSELTHARH